MQKQQEFFKILYPGGHSLKNFEIYISEMGSSSLVWKKKKIPSIKREICTSKIPEYFFLDKAPTSKTCFALPFFFSSITSFCMLFLKIYVGIDQWPSSVMHIVTRCKHTANSSLCRSPSASQPWQCAISELERRLSEDSCQRDPGCNLMNASGLSTLSLLGVHFTSQDHVFMWKTVMNPDLVFFWLCQCVTIEWFRLFKESLSHVLTN